MPDMSKCFSHHTNRENPLTPCSPDDEPIEQDKPLAAPTDSLTHAGGGGFEFDTDDDPSISIPLNPTQKNQ